jgi:hypothetical protein
VKIIHCVTNYNIYIRLNFNFVKIKRYLFDISIFIDDVYLKIVMTIQLNVFKIIITSPHSDVFINGNLFLASLIDADY